MRVLTLEPVFPGERVRAGEFNSDGIAGSEPPILAERPGPEKPKAPKGLSLIGDGSALSPGRFWSDQSGATLIEYTLLISLVMLAVLTLIIAVGGWANVMWANFLTAVGP